MRTIVRPLVRHLIDVPDAGKTYVWHSNVDSDSVEPSHDHLSHIERTMLMRNKLPIALTLLALLVAAPLLSACHTTEGVGEDISAGGHAVTHAADKLTP